MNELNKLTEKVIGLAIKVHKTLGPGFVEKIYKRALKIEMRDNNLKVQEEYPILIKWKDKIIGKQKIDLLVHNNLIIELKAQTQIEDIHLQQLLSYLKASQKPLGLILNFGAKTLQIKRVIYSVPSVPEGFCEICDPKNESQKAQKKTQKAQKITYRKEVASL